MSKLLKSKFKTIVLIVMLLISVCNKSFVFADDDTIYGHGYFEYQIINNGVVIVNYMGNETEVTIPSMIAGMPVYRIAKGAFINKSVITLNIPDTLTDIDEGAIGEGIKVNFDANVNNDNDDKTDNNDNNDVDDGGTSSDNNTNTSDNTDDGKDIGGQVDEDDDTSSSNTEKTDNSSKNDNSNKNDSKDKNKSSDEKDDDKQNDGIVDQIEEIANQASKNPTFKILLIASGVIVVLIAFVLIIKKIKK